jgi:hypothetical protein
MDQWLMGISYSFFQMGAFILTLLYLSNNVERGDMCRKNVTMQAQDYFHKKGLNTR